MFCKRRLRSAIALTIGLLQKEPCRHWQKTKICLPSRVCPTDTAGRQKCSSTAESFKFNVLRHRTRYIHAVPFSTMGENQKRGRLCKSPLLRLFGYFLPPESISPPEGESWRFHRQTTRRQAKIQTCCQKPSARGQPPRWKAIAGGLTDTIPRR